MGGCVILVPVSMTQIHKYITLLLHLHEQSLLRKCWSVTCVCVWWEMQVFCFVFRKLKLWFPLEGQKADSLLWDSAFVLYSTEDAMTTSKVHSYNMALLMSWLHFVGCAMNVCLLRWKEKKRKTTVFDWQPEISTHFSFLSDFRRYPPRKHLKTNQWVLTCIVSLTQAEDMTMFKFCRKQKPRQYLVSHHHIEFISTYCLKLSRSGVIETAEIMDDRCMMGDLCNGDN